MNKLLKVLVPFSVNGVEYIDTVSFADVAAWPGKEADLQRRIEFGFLAFEPGESVPEVAPDAKAKK